MKVAIHKDTGVPLHPISWVSDWISYCERNNIQYEIIDCYKEGILEKIKSFDCLLWHFANYSYTDMNFARSILNACQKLGIKVFPDMNTSWHFDDKVAESFLLHAIGASIPDYHIFFNLQECADWLLNSASYPLVAKLRCGSGSNNVKLISNKEEGLRYARIMFRNGLANIPNTMLKVSSNIRSVKSLAMLTKRLKKIPFYIQTRRDAKLLPRERNYVYFQEFIENDGYDIRIKVVNGTKATYLIRRNRKDDFRASGGGDSFYDRSLVHDDILEIAFFASKALKMQTVAFDIILDRKDGKPKILEMSYGFPNDTAIKAGGYWDEKYIWHDVPMNVPQEVLLSLIVKAVEKSS